MEVEVEEAMTPHRRTTTTPRLHTENPLPAQAKKDGGPAFGLEFLAVPLQDIWQGTGKPKIKQGTQAILTINLTTAVVFSTIITEKEALHGEAEGERDHRQLHRLLLFLRLGMKVPGLGRQIEGSMWYINARWAWLHVALFGLCVLLCRSLILSIGFLEILNNEHF